MPQASFDPLDRLLLTAERCVRLLSRCRPIGLLAERARLQAALERGDPVEPRFRYPPPPAMLNDVMRALEEVATKAARYGVLGPLYSQRAQELLEEARIAQAVGSPQVVELASRRFPQPRGDAKRWAEAHAGAWASLPLPSGERIGAGDRGDPRSLLRQVQREVGVRRLPVRVVLTEGLMSSAATGEDCVYVNSNMQHSAIASRRIAIHEVEAHASPRSRCRGEPLGLFRVASRGASEDEEGRALLLEQREGLLTDERRRQLGLRHLAAQSVRRGATWVDTARLLLGHGSPPGEAVQVASRAHRGGGLAREVIYLPAFYRVQARLAAQPELESWLSRGRLSLDAASYLREHGLPPEGGGTRETELRVSVP